MQIIGIHLYVRELSVRVINNVLYMKEEGKIYLKFALLNLFMLLITQPGSIAFANFDAPYGFLKDFTTWIMSFIGLSPLSLLYLILKRDQINRKIILGYVIFILATAFVVYRIQQLLFEGFRSPSYQLSFPLFLFACFLSALLSLMILPAAVTNLSEIYLRYDYDKPLGIIEILILILIIMISYRLKNSP